MLTVNNFFFFAFVGYRASGKSWLARQLAILLAQQFKFKLALLSTDFLLEETQKRSIAQIVAKDGWQYFRNVESALLKNIITNPQQYITEKKNITIKVSKKIPEYLFNKKIITTAAQVVASKNNNKKFSENNLNINSALLTNSPNMHVCLLDCGGGIVLEKCNRKLLKQNCAVVFIDTPTSILVQRQLRNPRPSFEAKRAEEEGEQLNKKKQIETETKQALEERKPLYEEVAKISLKYTELNFSNSVKKSSSRESSSENSEEVNALSFNNDLLLKVQKTFLKELERFEKEKLEKEKPKKKN